MLSFNIVQAKRNERGNFGKNAHIVSKFRHILQFRNVEVKLTPTNQVAVEAAQSNPLGAELEPVDTAVVGTPVTVEKVKGKKC